MRRLELAGICLTITALAGCTISPPAALVQNEAPATALRTVSWVGTGQVFPPGQVLDIHVATRVTPFVRARSDSWILAQGPTTARAMIIEPNGGWIERGGKREPMPETAIRNERQQFAIYGQMQQAMAQAPALVRQGLDRVVIRGREGVSVDSEFRFDREGRLIEARNQVDDPETAGKKVDQLFRFSGEVASNGLRWPRRMEMLHGEKPYFILEIKEFTAE